MAWKGPTNRLVDGERIDGAWSHVWVKGHSSYYVDDLFVYADGLLRCGDTFDLQGLGQRLESGKIALTDPGQPPSKRPEPTPRWSARYPEPLTNQGFLREVADEVEALNGRPTTSDCSSRAGTATVATLAPPIHPLNYSALLWIWVRFGRRTSLRRNLAGQRSGKCLSS